MTLPEIVKINHINEEVSEVILVHCFHVFELGKNMKYVFYSNYFSHYKVR